MSDACDVWSYGVVSIFDIFYFIIFIFYYIRLLLSASNYVCYYGTGSDF